MRSILQTIGAQVRSPRAEQSQAQFAERVGLPQSRITPIEHGQANITLLTLHQIVTRAGGILRLVIHKRSRSR